MNSVRPATPVRFSLSLLTMRWQAYDAYQLPQILKSTCSLDLSKPSGAPTAPKLPVRPQTFNRESRPGCNATQLAPVQAYHTMVGERALKAVEANGAAAPSGAFIVRLPCRSRQPHGQ